MYDFHDRSGFGGPLIAAAVFLTANTAMADEQINAGIPTLRAAVLIVETPRPRPLSRLDIGSGDDGLAGARLADADNGLTGSFLGLRFETISQKATPHTAVEVFDRIVSEGVRFVIVAAPADILLALSDRSANREVLLFNVWAPDDRLRGPDCRSNVLHIAPSRAQLADGLAQYLVWKNWKRWLLILGSHRADQLFAASLRRAARRFGARIVQEKIYEDTGGARRTDTGHVLVQRQIPAFTRSSRKHDVVVAADESDVFAAYLPYRTWQARPVAGSAGLRPTSWAPEHEAWGATQFQRRFERDAGRRVTPLDSHVWLALRALAEAATRTGSIEYGPVRAYLSSDRFAVAAFKGRKLSFRNWNGQLRQPILLTDSRLVVSVSPQEGFLHPVSTLDTLGIDRQTSRCGLDRQ